MFGLSLSYSFVLPSKLEMSVVDGSEGFRRLMLKVNDIP